MTRLANNIIGISFMSGVLFSGPALAVNSIQEAVEENRSQLRAEEVAESSVQFGHARPWYLEDITESEYVITDTTVISDVYLSPWYLQG